MSTTVSRGSYYKLKTHKWFKSQGYFTAPTEWKATIPIKGRTIWVTRDLLASDGIAMSKEKNQFIFWNSKFAINDAGQSDRKWSGKKDFNKFPFPDCVERWVVIWRHRISTPTIVKVGGTMVV